MIDAETKIYSAIILGDRITRSQSQDRGRALSSIPSSDYRLCHAKNEAPEEEAEALSFTKSNMADKIVRVCIRLGIGGLFVINASGELFPHQACKQVNALKDENGILVDVPETFREQFKEVAVKLGLKNSAQKVTLFVNEGFHAVSAGSTWFPAGAVIGLPRWYLYQTEEEVATSGLKFQGRNIQWDSELGETVKFCYVPTKDMIAFTIGHELAHIQRLDFKMFDILPRLSGCF